jgi:hypothetical protein
MVLSALLLGRQVRGEEAPPQPIMGGSFDHSYAGGLAALYTGSLVTLPLFLAIFAVPAKIVEFRGENGRQVWTGLGYSFLWSALFTAVASPFARYFDANEHLPGSPKPVVGFSFGAGLRGGVVNGDDDLDKDDATHRAVRPALGGMLEIGVRSMSSMLIELEYVGEGPEREYLEIPVLAKMKTPITPGGSMMYFLLGPSLGLSLNDNPAEWSGLFGGGVEVPLSRFSYFSGDIRYSHLFYDYNGSNIFLRSASGWRFQGELLFHLME